MESNSLDKRVSLSFQRKMGYSIASIGQQMVFNIFFIYFLMFLTDIAGISPAVAGTIALVSVLWDGVTDPIMGAISDRSRDPKGRRRKYILYGLIPVGFIIVAAFTKVDMGSFTVVYYVVVAMLFWTFFTIVDIPYLALGGEITDDFNERTTLRGYCSVLMNIGIIIASSGVILIIGYFSETLNDAARGWQVAMGISAIPVVITYFISWIATKGMEEKNPNLNKQVKPFNLLLIAKEYISVLQNVKASRSVMLTTLFFTIGHGFVTVNGMYYLMYYGQLDFMMVSMVMLVPPVVAGILSPIVSSTSNKYGKKIVYIIGILSYMVTVFLFAFIDLRSNPSLAYIIYGGVGVGTAFFWTLIYAFAYDLSELDTYITGERRQGIMIGLMAVFTKLGPAFAMWLVGVWLEIIGYDALAQVQSEATLEGIVQMQTIFPATILLLAVLVMLRYPLNKEMFDVLQQANM